MGLKVLALAAPDPITNMQPNEQCMPDELPSEIGTTQPQINGPGSNTASGHGIQRHGLQGTRKFLLQPNSSRGWVAWVKR